MQRRPIAAPMKWRAALHAAERLRDHRPLHRMERPLNGRGLMSRIVQSQGVRHFPRRVPKVPREAVAVCIDVARAAGHRSVAGDPRIKEEATAFLDRGGHGIETSRWHFGDHHICSGVYHTDAVRDFVQHVETGSGRIERKPARTAHSAGTIVAAANRRRPHIDPRLDRAGRAHLRNSVTGKCGDPHLRATRSE